MNVSAAKVRALIAQLKLIRAHADACKGRVDWLAAEIEDFANEVEELRAHMAAQESTEQGID